MTGEVISVVPARKGSKGIPRKNLRELGDKPLVAHAIATSLDSKLVDQVVLTTDSQRIAQIGHRYGADRVIDRSKELATDEVPLAPVIQHACDELEYNYTPFKYVLCFQPTTPLVSTSSIDEGIRSGLEQDTKSLIFVRDETHYYWKENHGDYTPISGARKNRQWMDSIYAEIGVFLTRRELVNEGRRVGPDPELHEVSRTEGIDIDTYEDWLLADSQLNRKQLVYRVTGNDEIGSGHVYRGITIADHIFEHDIVFATLQDDTLAIDKLEKSNYEFQVFDNNDSFSLCSRTQSILS